MLDLTLASAHHLLAFLLVATLAMEFALARPGLRAGDLALLGRVDGLYGALAMAIALVGIGRVVWGLKGWEYYVWYPIFWAKMAAFLGVGALSVIPTVTILRWRRRDAGVAIADTEIRKLRQWLVAEAALLALVPILAAAMARGYGI